eukprot:Em0023g556a
MSNFSSIADVPDHLERQYGPLGEVFQSHGLSLPQRTPPESNSGAMIKALKALQEKIRALEQDRSAAAEKLRHLSEEAQKHTTTTATTTAAQGHTTTPPETRQRPASPPHATVSQEQDLKGRLHSLDARLVMQSKELDHMRERLRQAEADRNEAILRTRWLEEQRQESEGHQWTTPHVSRRSIDEQDRMSENVAPEATISKETEEKVRLLEQAQTHLSAQHSVTESRMKELESQLAQRLWHRGHQQDKDTELHTEMPLLTERDVKPKSSVHKPKKGTFKVPAGCTCDAQLTSCNSYCSSKPLPDVHYHASLKDVPFVVGTSTSPSHSLGANCQCILATMKRHNALLCGAAAVAAAHGKKKRSSATTRSRELLATLEEELGHLAFEHQELSRRLQEERGDEEEEEGGRHPRTTSDLEEQLRLVTRQMEIKAEQIRAVKLIHPHVKQVRPCRSAAARTREGRGKCPSSLNAELLRGMKAIQSTLQRDDLSWN